MILSSYNNQYGDSVARTVEFNEYHFPKCYKVSVVNLQGKPAAGSSMVFSGTEEGAKDSARYYQQVASVCDQRLAAVVAEEQM